MLENALSLHRKEPTSMEQALPKQVMNINSAGRQRAEKEEMLFWKTSSATCWLAAKWDQYLKLSLVISSYLA